MDRTEMLSSWSAQFWTEVSRTPSPNISLAASWDWLVAKLIPTGNGCDFEPSLIEWLTELRIEEWGGRGGENTEFQGGEGKSAPKWIWPTCQLAPSWVPNLISTWGWEELSVTHSSSNDQKFNFLRSTPFFTESNERHSENAGMNERNGVRRPTPNSTGIRV